jgi:hypothetical protein
MCSCMYALELDMQVGDTAQRLVGNSGRLALATSGLPRLTHKHIRPNHDPKTQRDKYLLKVGVV